MTIRSPEIGDSVATPPARDRETVDRWTEGVADVRAALRDVTAIREELLETAAAPQALLAAIHPGYRQSARNLLHYLCLRRHDLRPLQGRLAALGLSSLGRAESHVLATIDAVLGVLHRLAQETGAPPHDLDAIDFAAGQRLLADHTTAVLGPVPVHRGVRIMVTMSSEAAHDYSLVRDLVEQGMDCLRINCAHDDPSAWLQMVQHARRASEAVGRPCRIAMDLGGPKLRTGPIAPGQPVLRVRPQRDGFGRVTAPARVWLAVDADCDRPSTAADACLSVPESWLARLQEGDAIRLRDARDARRMLRVADVTPRGCWALLAKTAYLVEGTVLKHRRDKKSGADDDATIETLPPSETTLRLRSGDMLVITRDLQAGRPASRDSSGRVLTPATIGCTIPAVFDDVRPGEAIWFDDGKIGGVVERVESSRVSVRITQTPPGGAKLGADKGINLPDSRLALGALTSQDLEDLKFVAEHADIVELSFANTAHDVDQLQQHLLRLGGRRPAIVLKIETRRGFENLPEMLLTAMRWPSCGVMIARGDLAVECGFERLAEVQEEILWICEAAHVPVIWATQVLESLAKQGMPSRAEITDAAMGHRAECVMLNKGPHVRSAVRVLDDILRRMEAHQAKKRSMLRELRLAHALRIMPLDLPQRD